MSKETTGPDDDLAAELADLEREIERHEVADAELDAGATRLRDEHGEAEAEVERLGLATALGDANPGELEEVEKLADELNQKAQRVERALLSARSRLERLRADRTRLMRRIKLKSAREAVVLVEGFDPTPELDAARAKFLSLDELTADVFRATVDAGIPADRAAKFLHDRPRRTVDAVISLALGDWLISYPRPAPYYRQHTWPEMNTKKAVLDLIDKLDAEMRQTAGTEEK